MVLYLEMKCCVIENRGKRYDYWNDQSSVFRIFRSETVYLQKEGTKQLIPIFPVHKHGQRYYPLKLAYSSTVHKTEGQTIGYVTLVFDQNKLTAGLGYVSISRVRDFVCVATVLRLDKMHSQVLPNQQRSAKLRR